MIRRLAIRLARYLAELGERPRAWRVPWSNGTVTHANRPRPPRTVIRLGRYYMQEWGGWGQLSTASHFTEKQFRKVWKLYPIAAWLSVLTSETDHTEPR